MGTVIELRRADIGFGKVVLDERGVTRKRLLSRSFIAWDQVEDYRLKITLTGQGAGPLYAAGSINVLQLIDDIRAAMRDESQLVLALELITRDDSLFLDGVRFRDLTVAVGYALGRIGSRLAQAPRAELARTGVATFGHLRLTRQGVHWRDRDPLPRADVEVIELFNSSPVKLRVMKHGKILPYAQTETANLPALHALLEIAQDLGYPVRGLPLFEALADPSGLAP